MQRKFFVFSKFSENKFYYLIYHLFIFSRYFWLTENKIKNRCYHLTHNIINAVNIKSIHISFPLFHSIKVKYLQGYQKVLYFFFFFLFWVRLRDGQFFHASYFSSDIQHCSHRLWGLPYDLLSNGFTIFTCLASLLPPIFCSWSFHCFLVLS